MKRFTKISESKDQVTYVRNVIFEEDYLSYFDYQDGKTEDYDNKIKSANSQIVDVIYTDIKAKDGDTVFLVMIYDELSDFIVYAFKDVYNAISFTLIEYNKAKERAAEYHSMKIFKRKVNSEVRYKSHQEYNKKDYIIHTDINIPN